MLRNEFPRVRQRCATRHSDKAVLTKPARCALGLAGQAEIFTYHGLKRLTEWKHAPVRLFGVVMQVKPNHGSLGLALAVALAGFACNRSSVKEAPITGKSGDPPTTMQGAWPVGKRCIYRVETVTSSEV